MTMLKVVNDENEVTDYSFHSNFDRNRLKAVARAEGQLQLFEHGTPGKTDVDSDGSNT